MKIGVSGSMRTRRGIFLRGAWTTLMLTTVFLGPGCTFLENLRREAAPAEPVNIKIVDLRTDELTNLENNASVSAPVELGRARAVLDEMAYYRELNDPVQVQRLDGKMADALEKIRLKTAAAPVDSNDQTGPAQAQISSLKSRLKELEKKTVGLQKELDRQEKAAAMERGSLIRRLEIAQASREDAIAEVVRMRARIQGMASQAEASAMFAEARVLLDRMVEEAYNQQALMDLELAQSYLNSGKEALDSGNPGGAAYLFDLIPGLYEVMLKGDPSALRVIVTAAALRKSPAASAPQIGTLYMGNAATGIEKRNNWVKVKTASGQTGWVMANQVQ